MNKSVVQQQFGPNAIHYRASTVHSAGASLQRLVDLTKPQRHWAVLDVATGAGHTAAAFAPHVATVVAADLTPEMLTEVGKLARDRHLANLRTAAADAESLPFEDSSFDLVTCRIAPHHFVEIPQFLAETSRVLRPGGMFGLVDNVSPCINTVPGFTPAELTDASVRYNAWEAERDPSHVRTLTITEWDEACAVAGLKIQHSELIDKQMDFGTWCRNMSCPDATIAILRDMLGNASPALKAFLKPVDVDDGTKFTLTEYLVIATKPH